MSTTVWNHWNATHREVEAFELLVLPFFLAGASVRAF